MKKRLLISALFIVLLVTLASAADTLSITFTSPDNTDFNGYFLSLAFGDALFKDTLNGSSISVPKIPGEHAFVALLDSSSTPAIDYYGSKKIPAEENNPNFMVFPVGYLQGKVLDTEGNLIPKAKLSFACFSSITVEYPEKTDGIGFFSVKYAPIGTCSLIASSGEAVGTAEFEIKKGEVTNVEIVLEKKVAGSALGIYLLGAIVLIIILFIILLVSWKWKRKPKPALESLEEIPVMSETGVLPKQTQVILQTLNDKEKSVVQFLLENHNHTSQAKIRYATHIPRTSLARVLEALQRKKLVEVDKDGKMVEVKLTKLFLGE
ncbi:hypothetical protein HZC30_03765 [Candidatus Woesearchaeota archaeon]|nr:hypothetical protein [Candidatus Woesearchaeota archaeon]